MTARQEGEVKLGHCPHCDETVEKTPIEGVPGVWGYPEDHIHNGNPGNYKDKPAGRGGRVDT